LSARPYVSGYVLCQRCGSVIELRAYAQENEMEEMDEYGEEVE